MTQWREDAPSEWPEAAAATGEVSADGIARDRRVTQVFAGGDVRVTERRRPDATEILRGIPRQSEGEADSLAPGTGARPAVRDPWQEQEAADRAGHGRAGHTHDPHEVTVQLDAVQLGDGFVRQVKEGTGAEAAADRPVFVDESGRRSRRLRRIGMVVALACGVYAVVIVATLLSGNSNAPWLPVPSKKEGPPAGQVDTPPLPAEPAPTGGTGATAPGGTPTADEVTAPSPGPSALEPVATAGPGRPDTTADPSPTATRTTPAPGTGVTEPAPSKPANPPSTPVPDPTPTGGTTPEPPTETTGTGDDGGTGTVADGPAEPRPGPAQPAA
ncbi:hypothetical protein [Streptomyces lomondensis]|uniref:Translation initiation factor IF-2 n=1 Tax=Streptomyces lomondensis TaxID=68229 RepID=A0ABQ2WXF9_9ACTN|nr:hypothetical protein [Streptomyces lomondensis]MCF0078406.1 hypothetical protein [Streptomyces lomondensis]GGW77305.1 hypothetical protein GCM10010383_00590 [Streptomyces lomondensis]